jgi:hypothetical protein
MQLIPEDFEYSSMNGDAFVSTDATSQIKEGSEVRIKIVGVRADPQDMVRAVLLCILLESVSYACCAISLGIWIYCNMFTGHMSNPIQCVR